MEESKDLVCIYHGADPGIPGGVEEAIAKTSQDIEYNDDWIWWV
jgi:hypothetical protein